MSDADPEMRIAELEQQLAAAQKTAASVAPPQQLPPSAGIDEVVPHHGATPDSDTVTFRVSIAGDPSCSDASTTSQTTPSWFYPVFVTIMLLGGAMGGAAILLGVVPPSTKWMGGIVCSSPHQLTFNTFGGEVDYQCMSGSSSYTPNTVTMFALQSLLVLLLLCIGFAGWRLLRRSPRTGAS